MKNTKIGRKKESIKVSKMEIRRRKRENNSTKKKGKINRKTKK